MGYEIGRFTGMINGDGKWWMNGDGKWFNGGLMVIHGGFMVMTGE